MAQQINPMREGLTRGVLACLLILGPTIFLYYKPESDKLQEAQVKLAGLESELQNARQVAQTRDDLRRVTASLQKTLTFYEERLPSESDIPGLLEELQEIVSESRVKLVNVDMQRRTTMATYEVIPFGLTVSGGYHDIGRVVNNIERGKRFMGVNDISIKGGDGGTAPHEATFEVSTFRFIESNKS